MITDRIEGFIKKYGMLPESGGILCAVSGGADSMCLLHYFASTRGDRVVCAHFDHMLRGEESRRDALFVERECERLGVSLEKGSGDVRAYAARTGKGIEDAARQLRYAFLRDAAERTGCAVVATAHNAEDNAETVLLNLVRGTGLKGLGGIPPVRGNIIRPLLCLTRGQIEAYLEENGVGHIEDSTNALDGCARNRLRHHVLPVLRGQNASFAENILSAAQLLREDEAFLDALAREFIEKNYRGRSLPAAETMALARPVRARVFRLLCEGAGRVHIDAVEALCAGEGERAHADVPGLRVTRERGRLIFGAPPAVSIEKREIIPGREVFLEEISKKIFCRFENNASEINNSFNTFCFKCESICGKMTIASKSDGDRVRLSGRGCTKSLKKLFSEAGLTLAQRRATPVLYDDGGVIAVCGFGLAERCEARPGDDIYIVEITDI